MFNKFLGIIYGIDFDLKSNVIFYGDRNDSSIWTVSLNRISDLQDDRSKLISDTTVWDISFDWINNYLYWMDDRLVGDGCSTHAAKRHKKHTSWHVKLFYSMCLWPIITLVINPQRTCAERYSTQLVCNSFCPCLSVCVHSF